MLTSASLFQCELCWYRNIEKREPVPGRDDLYLTCIRRANLDAMLGKAPFNHQGPPTGDSCGLG